MNSTNLISVFPSSNSAFSLRPTKTMFHLRLSNTVLDSVTTEEESLMQKIVSCLSICSKHSSALILSKMTTSFHLQASIILQKRVRLKTLRHTRIVCLSSLSPKSLVCMTMRPLPRKPTKPAKCCYLFCRLKMLQEVVVIATWTQLPLIWQIRFSAMYQTYSM